MVAPARSVACNITITRLLVVFCAKPSFAACGKEFHRVVPTQLVDVVLAAVSEEPIEIVHIGRGAEASLFVAFTSTR